MERNGALSPFEERLRTCCGRRGRRLIDRWSAECAPLAQAGLTSPVEVPALVSTLRRDDGDEILCSLIGRAQSGDDVATAAVIVCLRPGLLALASRTHVPVDEVVAEAALVLMEFPSRRRRRVAAGVLLDVRHRFWYQRKRQPPETLVDRFEDLEREAAPDHTTPTPAAEELLELVHSGWRAGVLTTDDARLIIETRVLGNSSAMAGARRGLRQEAARLRRWRAEQRLAAHCANRLAA